jgi:predicted metallopeptidase
MGNDMESKILKNGVSLISKIRKSHMKLLGHVDPSSIIVLNTYGAVKKKYLAKIRNINCVFRSLLDKEYRGLLYVIELNKDALWFHTGKKDSYKKLRNIVLMHELHHISPKKIGQLRGHQVLDFSDVLKEVGIGVWENNYKDLPDILANQEKKKGTD